MASSSASLDFESLLAREYRPALVTQLLPREKYNANSSGSAANHHNKKQGAAGHRQTHPTLPTSAAGSAEPSDAAQDLAQRVIVSLVKETPEYRNQAKMTSSTALSNTRDVRMEDAAIMRRLIEPSTRAQLLASAKAARHVVDPKYCPMEFTNWEANVRWKQPAAASTNSGGEAPRPHKPPGDPMDYLLQPRNHHLDDPDLLANIPMTREAMKNIRVPLILEFGTAGRSVAAQFVSHRPLPATKSTEYQNRRNGIVVMPVKDRETAKYEERQKRRDEMEHEKTKRVEEAMGTLGVVGKGRTITSSLMGPGGTERTGRPSRLAGGIQEVEYIEQLDLVNQHTMLRHDWSKILLREYQRPKLPISAARLAWQLQIRYIPETSKANELPGIERQIRTEADLSPSSGKLILLEYCEERLPIALTKGTRSKIVNYYRGDRAKCPISAGGGDRPARRKVNVKQKETNSGSGTDGLPKLQRRATNIMDWVGKVPKQKDRSNETIDVLAEGVTELLHPKVHGPFLASIEEDTVVSCLVSNLFVAPLFRHEPENTDFLMVLTPPGGQARTGQRDSMGVILREMPTSMFCVGQTEPRAKVHAPNSTDDKTLSGKIILYQIARAISRAQARDGHGLKFEDLRTRVMPSHDIQITNFRQRLKLVAVCDKTSSIWTPKPVGFEDYHGLEVLGRSLTPEDVATFEASLATRKRLSDLGMDLLIEKGANAVTSTGFVMVYLAGQWNATKEFAKKVKKLYENSKASKRITKTQLRLFEKAADELSSTCKILEQRYNVAKFIYEELQLASWHVTREFIDVHTKGEGNGMMKLTGLGDPSGQGAGFSFLRDTETKQSKHPIGNGALTDQSKKITGTEDDLRKLNMKEMAALLRHYGMKENKIKTLKRWDRVHCIRDLSTKAASDGMAADGLERFARGEKIKLSDQKRMYTDRIKVIWNRQVAALSAQSDRGDGGADDDIENAGATSAAAQRKVGDDDSDSGSDDEDFADALADEMTDQKKTNQLIASQVGGVGQLRTAKLDQDLNKDAQALAAFQKEQEEARATKEGIMNMGSSNMANVADTDRKVIRRKITKTQPDGRRTTTFKFVIEPNEVGAIIHRLEQGEGSPRKIIAPLNTEQTSDEKPPGHAMFEEEDNYDFSSKGRGNGKRKGVGLKRARVIGVGAARNPAARPRHLQLGKLKKELPSTEDRKRKLKKEEEDMEVYVAVSRQNGTNNRRERGSIRDRRPHIKLSELLEEIRHEVEIRPFSAPFHKPVSMKILPKYYEVISHPMDLGTIKSRNADFQYQTANAMAEDFLLMQKNAIKFNGEKSPIALEAVAIYDFVKSRIEANRQEFTALEEAVSDMYSGKPKKKKAKITAVATAPNVEVAASTNIANIDGVAVNLGDLENYGSDDDDSD